MEWESAHIRDKYKPYKVSRDCLDDAIEFVAQETQRRTKRKCDSMEYWGVSADGISDFKRSTYVFNVRVPDGENGTKSEILDIVEVDKGQDGPALAAIYRKALFNVKGNLVKLVLKFFSYSFFVVSTTHFRIFFTLWEQLSRTRCTQTFRTRASTIKANETHCFTCIYFVPILQQVFILCS